MMKMNWLLVLVIVRKTQPYKYNLLLSDGQSIKLVSAIGIKFNCITFFLQSCKKLVVGVHCIRLTRKSFKYKFFIQPIVTYY